MTDVIEVLVEAPVTVIEVLVEPQIQVIEVIERGIQGPPGVPAHQIHVSANPPENPQINDIWIDIS